MGSIHYRYLFLCYFYGHGFNVKVLVSHNLAGYGRVWPRLPVWCLGLKWPVTSNERTTHRAPGVDVGVRLVDVGENDRFGNEFA